MSTETDFLNQIINPLTTLVAAFAGAWIAFRFERQSKKDELIKNNIRAANRSLYTIYNMWDILTQYHKEVISEYKYRDDAWLNMAATPTTSEGLSRFSYNELDFILQTGSPNIYANLLLEEQRFAHALNLISMRSNLITNTVFPRLTARGINPGDKNDRKIIEDMIGIDTAHKLKHYTTGIINNVEEDLLSLVEVYDELYCLMKDMYPSHKFIKVIFNE